MVGQALLPASAGHSCPAESARGVPLAETDKNVCPTEHLWRDMSPTFNFRLMCPLWCISGGAGILACLCRTFLSGRIGSRGTACRGRQECLPHRAPPEGHEPNFQRPTSSEASGQPSCRITGEREREILFAGFNT